MDPTEDACPPENEESQCEHFASEHRRIVELKKEELKQRIKHAKMAERIRDNIRQCLPAQDDCNTSCNNDSRERGENDGDEYAEDVSGL